MAVLVRLGASGMPRRAAPAAMTLVSSATRATGNLAHRVTAVYGTVPVAMSGPATSREAPPGPTNGLSSAVPDMYPTWSVVRPSLPRVLPWAGGIPHGIPGVTTTPVEPSAGPVMNKPAFKRRTGAAQGRVTTAPKPTFRWVRQGG